MCVPVVGLRALEKGCAARAFSGSTQQSLKDTDYVPQSSKVLLLLKHFFFNSYGSAANNQGEAVSL